VDGAVRLELKDKAKLGDPAAEVSIVGFRTDGVTFDMPFGIYERAWENDEIDFRPTHLGEGFLSIVLSAGEVLSQTRTQSVGTIDRACWNRLNAFFAGKGANVRLRELDA
jgi:hypothetical protein